jgi:hypothetical protein
VKWAFKRRNISNGEEVTVDFLKNLIKDRVMRALSLVSKFNSKCLMFCVYNRVICANKCRNICKVKDVTVDFRQNWMKDRILREGGLVSALEVVCTTFGV